MNTYYDDNEGPQWDAGTLSAIELERILVDALADLWLSSEPSQARTQERLRIFRRRVELALYCATGLELWITNEREGG